MDEIKEQFAQYNQLFQEADDLYHDIAVKSGLPESGFIILYELSATNRPCTQKEIGERYYLKKQTIHSAWENLIAANYIQVSPLEHNSRMLGAVLTEEGKRVADATVVRLMAAEHRAFGMLTAAEREELLCLSKKHLSNLKIQTENLFKKD